MKIILKNLCQFERQLQKMFALLFLIIFLFFLWGFNNKLSVTWDSTINIVSNVASKGMVKMHILGGSLENPANSGLGPKGTIVNRKEKSQNLKGKVQYFWIFGVWSPLALIGLIYFFFTLVQCTLVQCLSKCLFRKRGREC